MAFLLTDGCAPWTGDSGWADSYRLSQAKGRTLKEHSATILVTGTTGFYNHVSGQDGNLFPGNAWIALEGFLTQPKHLATFKPNKAAFFVLQLLRKYRSLEPLSELKGNFSLLIAFPAKKHYVLLRDNLGARSAFYASNRNAIALSSRSHLIGGLIEFGLRPDPKFMAHMFALRKGTPLGHSAFLDVTELRPGEQVSFRDGRFDSTPRDRNIFEWDPPFTAEVNWIQHFHDAFARAVDKVVDPDDPPFVMLSGGLDSAPVAAMAQKKLLSHGKALDAVSWRLRSFPNCDESAHVADIASHLRLKLHTFDADDLLPFSSFDAHMMPLDFPIPNLFRRLILATYENGQRLGHRVFLNGNAGDFIYPQQEWLLTDQISRLDLQGAISSLAQELQKYGMFRMHQSRMLRHLIARIIKRRPRRAGLPGWLTVTARTYLEDKAEGSNTHPVRSLSDRFTGTIIGQGTASENGISAEYGLQRRDPFVDEDLLKLMLKMPFSLSWRAGTSKWVMREAMKLKPYLPERIRTKHQTGLLLDFYNAGFDANRAKISDLLLRESTGWQEWIAPALLESALSGDEKIQIGRSLAGIAVGHAIWLREISRLPTINPS